MKGNARSDENGGIGVEPSNPSKRSEAQTALHDKAKESPDFRFYALFDKGYRKDVLRGTLFCGTRSMKEVDKVEALQLKFSKSETVEVPGLRGAIANIELSKEMCVRTGDHVLCVGTVRRFAANKNGGEFPLLSIGPGTSGRRVPG